MNLLQKGVSAAAKALGLEVKLRGGTVRNSAKPIHVALNADGRPIAVEWSAQKAIDEGQKRNAWVFTAISKVSTGLASVPLLLERRDGDNWTHEPEHELQRLLNRPNGFMNRQDVAERWAQHMLLSGNAVWWLNIVGGKPAEVWPIRPDEVRPIASRSEFISGYEWKVTSTDKRILQTAEVAHWMFVDPSNPRWGLAPIQAAAAAIDLDQAASNWNRTAFRNDGRATIAVMLDSSLNHEQMTQAGEFIREQVDGSHVRQALVLGGTSKVQPLSMSANDLDFLNGRAFTREEIGAVFGVPGVLMHAGEGVTYANLEAAKLILWEDRIVPMLDDYTSGLAMALFHFWGLEPSQWRIRADLSGVRALQGNLKTEAETGKLKAEMFAALVAAGVPANAAAQEAGLGLTDIPDGDLPRTPAAAVPALPSTKAWRGMERKSDADKEVAERLKRADRWEAELVGRVAELLEAEGNAIAAAYARGQPWEDALRLADWEDLLSAIHTAVIESEGAVAYAALLGTITAGGGGSTFDLLADNVTEWVAEHVGENIKHISDTTRATVTAEVRAGVEAGESAADIAARLRQSAGFGRSRAAVIARTEVSAAMNAAHQLNAEQMAAEFGLVIEKVWRTAGDNRVRDDHRLLNGETVPLDQPFSNNEMFPNEPNCRCVVTYQPTDTPAATPKPTPQPVAETSDLDDFAAMLGEYLPPEPEQRQSITHPKFTGSAVKDLPLIRAAAQQGEIGATADGHFEARSAMRAGGAPRIVEEIAKAYSGEYHGGGTVGENYQHEGYLIPIKYKGKKFQIKLVRENGQYALKTLIGPLK